MLIVIVSPNNVIIFKKFIGETKKPMEYLLINAALDTLGKIEMDGYVVKSKLYSSGHKLLISHKSQESMPKKFVELIDQYFIQEMFNPYVDDNELLSSEFSSKVEEAVKRTFLKVNFSI